ncbi:YbgC/FadM family acyl-CoA thioesterase [uncultured Helicobacter sp.]|uniref:YbgC/FadM family acyl-CoA thioesterase n=1 Tax=uncultured Helicobacter sp. TaxID=175537 RepID=UPI00260E0D10|nr:YbgC/FadM family acyl-CoA thioesterase [uncultured Helicobacter sp.]
MRIRVYYEDTDCGGIVYHSNYLKFCERARSEMFFGKGKMPYNQNLGFVVKSLNADFIKSARLGDELIVKTEVLELKKVQLTLRQEVFKGEEKIFSMDVKLGFIDFERGKPSEITQEFLEVLECKR